MCPCISICLQKNGHRNFRKISKWVQAYSFLLVDLKEDQKEFSWAWYKNTTHLELTYMQSTS